MRQQQKHATQLHLLTNSFNLISLHTSLPTKHWTSRSILPSHQHHHALRQQIHFPLHPLHHRFTLTYNAQLTLRYHLASPSPLLSAFTPNVPLTSLQYSHPTDPTFKLPFSPLCADLSPQSPIHLTLHCPSTNQQFSAPSTSNTPIPLFAAPTFHLLTLKPNNNNGEACIAFQTMSLFSMTSPKERLNGYTFQLLHLSTSRQSLYNSLPFPILNQHHVHLHTFHPTHLISFPCPTIAFFVALDS